MLLSTAEGPFWGEPFEADVRLDAATGAVGSYHLRFGDDRPLAEKRLTRASGGEPPEPVHWAFQFRVGG